MGHTDLPSPSSVGRILRRHHRIHPEESVKHTPWQRFEHEAPNRLWQMEFKGYFTLQDGQRCHPLTVLDDHSRFALCLGACGNQQGLTVQAKLRQVFRRYGLPQRMPMDNGSPWCSDTEHPYTRLTVWLMRLGIRVSHSRPYHPQTQGKDERFHRTLNVEVLQGRQFRDIPHCQSHFDEWRDLYNQERPHQALSMAVPASRYRVSAVAFPEHLPDIEYGPDDQVRRVQQQGKLHFEGRTLKVSKAFVGQPVALRPTGCEGQYDVYFCYQKIAHFDLKAVC